MSIPLIIIVGPTASGKSDLAVKLAKKFNGEIISADSRQVYQELNIGTGKITGKEMHEISHHLLDIADPKKQLSVADFKIRAEEAIKDIRKRNKIPIIVGGTGFWIDSLVYDFSIPRVPQHSKLRKKLEKKSAAELLAILKKLDPKRAKTIEQKNPRRIIRAIEITKALGSVPKLKKSKKYNTLWIGISPKKDELKKRIHKRLLLRLNQGMVAEARRMKRNKIPWKRFYELGLEYRFLADFLQKKITKKEFVEQLEKAINQYARRQMVWFKRNKEIHWVKNKKEAIMLVKYYLKQHPSLHLHVRML